MLCINFFFFFLLMIVLKHAARWTVYNKLLLAVNVCVYMFLCVCVYGALWCLIQVVFPSHAQCSGWDRPLIHHDPDQDGESLLNMNE